MSESPQETQDLDVSFSLATDMTVITVQAEQITVQITHPRDQAGLAGQLVEQLPEIIVAAIEQAMEADEEADRD